MFKIGQFSFFLIYVSFCVSFSNAEEHPRRIVPPVIVGAQMFNPNEMDEGVELFKLRKLYSEKSQYAYCGDDALRARDIFLISVKQDEKGPKGEDIYLPQLNVVEPGKSMSLYKSFPEGFDVSEAGQAPLNIVHLKDEDGKILCSFSIHKNGEKDFALKLAAPSIANASLVEMSLTPKSAARYVDNTMHRKAHLRIMSNIVQAEPKKSP